jgi:hypothetical protein
MGKERWEASRLVTVLVLLALIIVACGPISIGVWSYYTQVYASPLVLQAVERAEAHPTVREVLGHPVTVSTLVTRGQDLSYSSGGTSMSTGFWRPGVTRKRISMQTTIAGPKGSAWFSVTGTEDLLTHEWRDVRMEVYGGDIGDVKSFQVDLTAPDQPGTVNRGL